ncbi:MAG: hypothetical protein J1G02_05515 [Clostridiales bacterium]|nr:hypothetical protein [Clostridiales bacterium]
MVKADKRENIEKNFCILKNNFNNGIKEYKFGEICSILELDYSKASHDSKTAIINELGRYCDCGYKGNTYTFEIREIYDEPKELEKQTRNYPSVYADTFYCIIVALLTGKLNSNFTILYNVILGSRYSFFNVFGLTNDWFYKPEDLDELEEAIYNELQSSIFEIVHQGFKRGLDYLAKKGKIEHSKCSMIHYLDTPSNQHLPANVAEEDIIQDVKKDILESNNCASEHAFVEEYGFDYFKEQVNKQLIAEGFEYLYSNYRIALINDIEEEYSNIFGGMNATEIQKIIKEKRLAVNQKVLAQLPAKNKYEFDTANTHSTFRGHNYKERKNDIIKAIGDKIRKETGNIMISQQEIKDCYFSIRNELAKQIIEIN